MAAVFRPATAADEPILFELMREFYRHERMAWDEAAARGALHGVLADASRGRALLIELGAAVAGYLVVCFGWSLEFQGRDAFVDELYVREAFRGQGSARARSRLPQICVARAACALSIWRSSAATRARRTSTAARVSSIASTT
jgi:GNAT superfamily N-acetyltransferase